MPNADGYITYSTKLDNSDLVKDIQETKKQITSLQKDLDKQTQKRAPLADSVRELGAQLDSAKGKLAALNAEKKKYLAAQAGYDINNPASIEAAAAAQAGLVGMDARIASAEKEAGKLQAKFDKAADSLDRADANAAVLRQNLESSKVQAAGLEQQLARAQSLAPLTDAVGAAEARFIKFGKRIGTMFKKVFMFSVLLAGLRAVRSWFSSIIKTNDEAVAAMGRLKGALLTMAQPIVDVAVPAFVKLVNVLTQVVQVLANAMSLLFGKNVKDSAKAAKALDKEKKAIKGVGSAAKKATGFLAAFDEVNQVQDDSTSGGGGASTSGIQADFSGFDGNMVQSELDKLTAILGGALFAVGAILAFSGVNIPLGITLMALGAAVLYKEAEQNWDKLPQQLQTVISGALVLVGMVALVVGLCLALSGTNIPLGLGLVAIGAASIAAAAALNWDELGNTVAQKLAQIGAVIGPCIAVVGVFLLLTGNFPLGVAMIIAGAAIFGVSETVLNWDELGNTVTEKLGNIAKIIGGVIAVIGVILMLTGNIPLGLGMVVAGVSLFGAGAIAAKWDSLPNTVQGKLSAILKIIGGCLLVLGVILLLSGVAAPLGLGLIIAGAGILAVGEVTENWGLLKEKVKECWEGIKKYYNENIKKYLSIDYWKSKASDIVSGLCEGIRNGWKELKESVSSTISSAWEKAKSAFNKDDSGSSSSTTTRRGGARVQASAARIYSTDVPALARGAVIPANKRFMAVLGDQRNGNNLEAPEALIRQIVREESGGNYQIVALLQSILSAVQSGQQIVIDKSGQRVIGQVAAQYINDRARATGAVVIR